MIIEKDRACCQRVILKTNSVSSVSSAVIGLATLIDVLISALASVLNQHGMSVAIGLHIVPNGNDKVQVGGHWGPAPRE